MTVFPIFNAFIIKYDTVTIAAMLFACLLYRLNGKIHEQDPPQKSTNKQKCHN